MSLFETWFLSCLESLDLTPAILSAIWRETLNTLLMVFLSAGIGTFFGLPLGVFLATSKKGELFSMPWINRFVGIVANFFRSTPFIILAVLLIPFTRMLMGTTIGFKGAVVPLTIAVIPFVARLIETAIRGVDPGLIEAARAYGATPFQIVYKVLLPEALSGLALALTIAIVSLIGYSAMVGMVGGGGLGDLAIRYGYQRYMFSTLIVIVIILNFLVQGIQDYGDILAQRLDKRVRRN